MSKLFLTACLLEKNSDFSHLPHEKFLDRKNSSEKFCNFIFCTTHKGNNSATISIKFTVTKLGIFFNFSLRRPTSTTTKLKIGKLLMRGKTHFVYSQIFRAAQVKLSFDDFFLVFLGGVKIIK